MLRKMTWLAEPAYIQRLIVVMVMHFDVRSAAFLAWLWYQFTALFCAARRMTGCQFLTDRFWPLAFSDGIPSRITSGVVLFCLFLIVGAPLPNIFSALLWISLPM